MSGDAGLPPVVQDIDLDSAVVVRPRRRVVAGDGRVGRNDLLVAGRRHLLAGVGGPLHDQVAGGRAGTVADLIVVHHPPSLYFAGEVEAGWRRRQCRRNVGSHQQCARIMPCDLLSQLQFLGIDARGIIAQRDVLARVGNIEIDLP